MTLPDVYLLGGDIVQDDAANTDEVTAMVGAFGSADAAADLDGDGSVSISDVTAMVGHFGVMAPSPW